MHVLTRFLPIAVVALAVAGCGPGSTTDDEVVVVTTTTILGDVASNVVGEDGRVIVLIPIGADPHDFRASASQIAAINDADLVVANGLFLEEGLEDVLEAASDDGIEVLEVAPLLDPLPFRESHELEGDHDDEHAGLDPHVWLDPRRMADAALLIAAELDEIEPEPGWMARAEAYAEQLQNLDEQIAAMLASIPDSKRRIVTNHDSLGYFAERYGFEVIGTVIPTGSTVSSPSSEELATLVDMMRSEGVSAIFAETTQPEELAVTVAAELEYDVRVVSLFTGSLGEPGSGAETLIGMLTTNAARIADALAG